MSPELIAAGLVLLSTLAAAFGPFFLKRGAERRDTARIRRRFRLMIRWEGQAQGAQVRNLSQGGLSASLERPIPPGSAVQLRWPDGSAFGQARIVHEAGAAERGREQAVVGLSFSSLESAARRQVQRWLRMRGLMQLALAIGLHVFSAGIYLVALRLAPLSLCYPMTSLTYVWVTLISVLLLRERLTRIKVVGVATIILGVVLVTL